MVTREDMKKEAIKRMEKMGLFETVIKEFRDNDILNYSENTPLGGMLYWVSNEPEWEDIIKKVEQENDILVYHVNHCYTEFGELLSMLYVSKYNEEWGMDLDDIPEEYGDEFYPISYVYNIDGPELSEFGSIGVQLVSGGLIRKF